MAVLLEEDIEVRKRAFQLPYGAEYVGDSDLAVLVGIQIVEGFMDDGLPRRHGQDGPELLIQLVQPRDIGSIPDDHLVDAADPRKSPAAGAFFHGMWLLPLCVFIIS